MLLGLFYFASLWWVVRRLPQHVAAGVCGFPFSTLARMLVVLGAVYLLMDHRWERLAAVMLGFLIGRCLVFWQVGVSQHKE